jgi:hypothetical protein
MKAKEERSDYTCVEGWSQWVRLYNTQPGWKIMSFTPNSPTEYSNTITTHGIIPFSLPSGESVTGLFVQGDRDGSERGTWTNVKVIWGKLNVTLQEKLPATGSVQMRATARLRS